MAASANPLATGAGREILRAGGSAIDAAIAIQMVLTSGRAAKFGTWRRRVHRCIGMAARAVAFDGRETAPMAVDENLFLLPDGKPMDFYDAVAGGHSVGTPGGSDAGDRPSSSTASCPGRGCSSLQSSLPKAAFRSRAASYRNSLPNSFEVEPSRGAPTFTLPMAAPKAVGTRLENPALAATLRAIARGGPEGVLSPAISRRHRRCRAWHPTIPGDWRLADLGRLPGRKNATPLCSDYKRWHVCGMGPPSSGGIAVAQMLGMLSMRNIAVVPPVRHGGRLGSATRRDSPAA